MSDLRDWLRRHNLEEYADTFEANDIDLDILAELTEPVLERLGVSLGNRLRLMKVIRERAGSEPSSPPASKTATEFQSGIAR